MNREVTCKEGMPPRNPGSWGAAMTTLTGQTESLQLPAEARAVIDEGLEDALSVLRADRGNVQIVDPASGSLRIAAHAGFSDEFLEYFAIVDDDGSACGRAARDLAQTVIVDVNTDPRFAPHREIAAAAGFRAVNSTPLLDLRGHLVGVLSTHYPRAYRPPNADLELMKRFGELIGQAIEASLEADGQAHTGPGQRVAAAAAATADRTG
jgi:GAF domain-containing protein